MAAVGSELQTNTIMNKLNLIIRNTQMNKIILYIIFILALPAMLFAQYNGGNGGSGTVGTVNNSPLPVNLSSFTSNVNGRNITLNWVTASEVNNAGFEIQRIKSSDSKTQNYEKAGFIQGKGTVNTSTNYSYTDKKLDCGKYQYRLKQIDNNGNFEFYNLSREVEIGLPTKYDISQNYPNPFNPTTKIDFALPVNAKVTIKIFDITGREVISVLNNESRVAGYYTVIINASSLSSSVYFYRIISDKFIQVKKMVVLK